MAPILKRKDTIISYLATIARMSVRKSGAKFGLLLNKSDYIC